MIKHLVDIGIGPGLFIIIILLLLMMLLITVIYLLNVLLPSWIYRTMSIPFTVILTGISICGLSYLKDYVRSDLDSLPTTYEVEKRIPLEPFQKERDCTYENYLKIESYYSKTKLSYQETNEYGQVTKTINAGYNPLIYKKKTNQDKAELLVLKKIYKDKKVQSYYPYGTFLFGNRVNEYQLIVPKVCTN